MGRNKGTNNYSNNFEPQVAGLLDARTRVDTRADLTLTSTWTSSDGNVYLPKGIRVSVTDDTTTANNGIYVLMSDDYTVSSNWKKIDGDSGQLFCFTTDRMLDNSNTDTILNDHDKKLLDRLNTQIVDISNIAYIGKSYVWAFTSLYVPLSIILGDDTSIIDAIFIHPMDKKIMTISLDKINYTASPPKPLENDSSSNIKILTTPDLMNLNRTTSLNLIINDSTIIRNLSDKDVVFYSGKIVASGSENARLWIPISIAKAGTSTISIYVVTFLVSGDIYRMQFNSNTNTNVVTASTVTKIESSGGGNTISTYTTTLPLQDLFDGKINDVWTIGYYEEIYNIIDSLSAGKTILYNFFTLDPNDNTNQKGCNGVITASYQKSNIDGYELCFTGVNSDNHVVRVTLNESTGTTAVDVIDTPYITTLPLDSINNGTLITQEHINEVYRIFTNWERGLSVAYIGDTYRGILNIGLDRNSWGSTTTIYFSINRYDDTKITWKFTPNLNSKWEREDYVNSVVVVNLIGFTLSNTPITVGEGLSEYDAITQINNFRQNSGKSMISYYFCWALGFYTIYTNINNANAFYVEGGYQKYRVDYRFVNNETIEYTAYDVTPYDLNLEVRISDNKVQCRINEVIPDGYICLYRKKRCSGSLPRPKYNKYTIPHFYFYLGNKIKGYGVSVLPVTNMKPNEWTTIPIQDNTLVSQSTTDIRFNGNVHANPCKLTSVSGTNLNKRTAVLKLGLAYNVINPNFINGYQENNAIPKDFIKMGNIVKFKARLICNNIGNINSGYRIRYTMD